MSAQTVARPSTAAWRRASVVLVATLLAHAWVVETVDRILAGNSSEPPAPPAAIYARLLAPPSQVVPEPSPPAATPKPRPRPRPPRPPAPAAPAPPPAEAPPVAPVEGLPATDLQLAAKAATEESPPLAGEPVAVDQAPAEEAPEPERPLAPVAQQQVAVFEAMGPALEAALAGLPDLRAALAGAARYVYRTTNSELRLVSGVTIIEWSLGADGRYDLRLSTQAVGMTVLELRSEGTLRAFGLAPDRYTETRARRSAASANFDWDGRRVTFSRQPHERALVDGLQDRLSFQIQLMLLGQAQPQRFREGALTVMLMAGRDDVALYRFRSAGSDATDTGVGRLDAVRIERIVEHERDPRIEVWMVPELRWLPVRLRFTDRLGRVTESVLDAIPGT